MFIPFHVPLISRRLKDVDLLNFEANVALQNNTMPSSNTLHNNLRELRKIQSLVGSIPIYPYSKCIQYVSDIYCIYTVCIYSV